MTQACLLGLFLRQDFLSLPLLPSVWLPVFLSQCNEVLQQEVSWKPWWKRKVVFWKSKCSRLLLCVEWLSCMGLGLPTKRQLNSVFPWNQGTEQSSCELWYWHAKPSIDCSELFAMERDERSPSTIWTPSRGRSLPQGTLGLHETARRSQRWWPTER